ncbi:CinA family protein [Microbacterium sp. MPKO10]|uniref:CinA family protein n=1 Tax=Microbacterium sp. MPKO10 TaxID=2989818 RepID=UPI0022357141|nr:CinA family protein [Microbacterium sp. MPKO10]MCW4458262.1 CinA family protein [Microbacterium sp. MPKO10]
MSTRTPELIEAFTDAGLTLGVAESLTGGALCAELIRPAGASAVVVGGVVAYATALKASVLGVDASLLEAQGPVHPDVAAQMAAGVRSVVGSGGEATSVGVSTTGVAGPGSQGGQLPGTVYIAVDSTRGSAVRALSLHGDRDEIRAATVDAAVELLSDVVLRRRPNGE